MATILDLFAGPGGWDEGLRLLGRTDVLGVEREPVVCATAQAAGHDRLEADVSTLEPRDFSLIEGIIASPPCPDFSTAGQGAGITGASGRLVTEPLRWVRALGPAWTAWEQVAQVQPYWNAYAIELRRLGYRVWTGVLDSANYGVPQNRRRAVLLASRAGPVAAPPTTHAEQPGGLWDDERLPWATLADVLGLEPGWVYDSGQNSVLGGGRVERYVRSCDRPAGTLTGKTTAQWVLRRGDERRKLTTDDAVVLQTFRPDYPFQGTSTERQQQIGDAVPPLLAAHVLAAVGAGSLRAVA